MTAIAKSAKTHPAAKTYCGWEEPAICPPHLSPPTKISTYTTVSREI